MFRRARRWSYLLLCAVVVLVTSDKVTNETATAEADYEVRIVELERKVKYLDKQINTLVSS